MLLEKTSGAMRKMCDHLFDFVEQMTGEQPRPLRTGGWYRAATGKRAFLYLRLVGNRGSVYPPNSIHLTARWDDRFIGDGVSQKNHWYSSQSSADFSARSDHPEDVDRAEDFIRLAFQLLND